MMIAATVLAAALVATFVYRIRQWPAPKTRSLTTAIGVAALALLVGGPPLLHIIDRWTLRTFGSSIAILIAILLGTLVYGVLTSVAIGIITDTRKYNVHLAAVWVVAAAGMTVCWFLSDAHLLEARDPLAPLDLPSFILTLTYCVVIVITGTTTLLTSGHALRDPELSPKGRRTARGLWLAAIGAIGLSAFLAVNAFALDLPVTTVETVEAFWWLLEGIGLLYAGLAGIRGRRADQ